MNDSAAMVPLAQQAYRTIRQRIIDGAYEPGCQLSARRLVVETGMGATPVREGLARLHHEGLVHVLPRRGYVVARLDRRTLDNFFAIWRLVAPLIMEQGINRCDEDTRRELEEQAVQSLSVRGSVSQPSFMIAWNRLAAGRFRLLARATGNPHLIAINDRLQAENERIFTFYVQNRKNDGERAIGPGRAGATKLFLENLRARDGASAAERVRNGVERAYEELCAVIPEQ